MLSLTLFVQQNIQEKILLFDYIVCTATIKEGARFEDTNKMFEEPDNFDFKVTHKDIHQCNVSN